MLHSLLLLFFRGLFIKALVTLTCCDVLFAGDRYHIGRNLYLIHLKSMNLAAFLCPGPNSNFFTIQDGTDGKLAYASQPAIWLPS